MDSVRERPSVLRGLTMMACLVAAAVGFWAQGLAGTSTGGLALVTFLMERSTQPRWMRQLWYAGIPLFCIARTTYYLQRALAGSAASRTLHLSALQASGSSPRTVAVMRTPRVWPSRTLQVKSGVSAQHTSPVVP